MTEEQTVQVKHLPFKKAWGIFTVTDGWEDLGWVERYTPVGGSEELVDIHKFCKKKLRVGKYEDNTLFKYCPLCYVVIQEYN